MIRFVLNTRHGTVTPFHGRSEGAIRLGSSSEALTIGGRGACQASGFLEKREVSEFDRAPLLVSADAMGAVCVNLDKVGAAGAATGVVAEVVATDRIAQRAAAPIGATRIESDPVARMGFRSIDRGRNTMALSNPIGHAGSDGALCDRPRDDETPIEGSTRRVGRLHRIAELCRLCRC